MKLNKRVFIPLLMGIAVGTAVFLVRPLFIQQNEAFSENKMGKNRSLLGELWDFLRVRKKWWLLPTIIMLILVGILIIFGQSSSLSPFIYALF